MGEQTFDGTGMRTPCAPDEELRRLRGMLDGAFAFVGLLSAEGVLLEANHAVVEALGIRREDVIGKPLWDTYYWSHARASREMMRDAVERAVLGEVVRGDFIVRAAEETFVIIDATFAPLCQDGRVTQIVISAVDVTERVAHAEAARKVRHQLERAQRIAHIGSWHWDFAAAPVWSDQCYRLMGWSPSGPPATIEAFKAAVHPADRAAVDMALRRAVEEGVPADIEHRVVWPNGEIRILHQLGEAEFDANGKPLRMIGTSRDVTVLRNTCDELVEEKLHAEAASQTKSRLLANMSHELRTPLNAIIGFSELLLNQEDDLCVDKIREYLGDIHSSGKHLLSVINDILDISRIEAGKVDVREEPVPAEELVDAAQRMVRARAEDAGVELHCRAEHGALTLRIDRRLMVQALLNFASNAIKFTEAGGRVDIEAKRNAQGGADIIVSDTGIGMSSQDVARVGERFLQADGRLSRKYEGTGLGLVIAKRLIELQGGELIVQSKLGSGTMMTVRLPAAKVGAPRTLAAAS